MNKLFISSKSGKSLPENHIKHRLKNLTKAKLKIKPKINTKTTNLIQNNNKKTPP